MNNLMSNINIRKNTMDEYIVLEMQQDIYQITKYVRNGDFVIDVGANIGAFALFVKKKCPGANVIALEPMPSNFSCLKKNVEEKVLIEQIALSGKSGTMAIYDFGPEASACHSIYNFGIDNVVPVEVQTKTLEQIVIEHKIDHLRFLKLDCQGSEYDIIPNTSQEIFKKIDYIGMEVHQSIAATEVAFGIIPDYKKKSRRLYRHLLKTHIPIYGRLYSTKIQIWANRKLLSPHLKLWFQLKNVIAAKPPVSYIVRILIKLKIRPRTLKHLLEGTRVKKKVQ